MSRARPRGHVAALILGFAAIAATIVLFTRLWPDTGPPPPSYSASLVGTLVSGDESQEVSFRALYGEPDPGAFLLLLESPAGEVEVRPDLTVRTADGRSAVLSPSLLRLKLGFLKPPEGDALAIDLAAQVRHILAHPPNGVATGIRRWSDLGPYRPSLWYDGLSLPANAPRPETLLPASR